MADRDKGRPPDFTAITPATGSVAVDVSGGDQTFSTVAKALYVGGAGDVAVTHPDGSSGTFSSVPAGTILPVQVVSVQSSGTTASNIRGLI